MNGVIESSASDQKPVTRRTSVPAHDAHAYTGLFMIIDDSVDSIFISYSSSSNIDRSRNGVIMSHQFITR